MGTVSSENVGHLVPTDFARVRAHDFEAAVVASACRSAARLKFMTDWEFRAPVEHCGLSAIMECGYMYAFSDYVAI